MFEGRSVSFALSVVLFCSLFPRGWLARGEMVYVDATDGVYHPNHASPNSFNTLSDSATDWVTNTDGTAGWRFRDTGPGAVSYGASAYQGKASEGDGPFYTKAGGLIPGTTYGSLRLYFDISQNNRTWLIQYSLDGTNWSATLNRDTPGIVRLVDSTTDALGTVETGSAVNDTRCYFPVPGTVTANTNGEIRFYP